MSNKLVNLSFRHSKGFDLGLDIFRLADLYNRQSSLDHKITDPHSIGFYILIYVESGTGIHTVDFQTFSVEPHTLAVISKHQIQQFDAEYPLQGYIIVITEDFLQRALFDLESTTTNMLFDPISTQAYFLRQANSVLPHVQRLTEEYNRDINDPQHVPILNRELGILLLKAERLRDQQLSESAQRAESSPRLITFRDLLELNYKHHWTAEMYAQSLGFSKKTLGTLTRKHLNRSPKEVIDNRLLLEIKRLLSHTDLSIKEIAVQLGFEDPSNLNKFFKRVHGHTPTSFRRQVRQII